MSLNNISLPPRLLANLYQNVLVQGTASAVPVKKDVSFLGKNEKNILIVVNKADTPYLPDEELSFLTNVLSACQLGLTDVAIVNHNKINLEQGEGLLEQLKSKHVVLFDVETSVVGFAKNLQPYTVYNDGGYQYIAAPSLSEIEKSKEAKKQLWTALKQLFGI